MRKKIIIGMAALLAISMSVHLPVFSATGEDASVISSIGDVSGDSSVNAIDATLVLIAAAKTGVGLETDLTEEQRVAADVNQDTLINAKDATFILRYAASIGTGKAGTFEAFLKKELQPDPEDNADYQPLLESMTPLELEEMDYELTFSETGVTNAPQGLADAVTYDFDRDGTEELVTFCLTDNDKGSADVVAELYTWQNGESVRLDTLYLTDFLDLTKSDRAFPDTIFFSEQMSMQIVSVDDGNTMYFGALLNAEDQDYYRHPYPKGFGVFTVENGKFTSKMIGSSENFLTSHELCSEKGIVAAKLLPPSLEGKIPVSDCYVDEKLFRAMMQDDKVNDIESNLKSAEEDCDRVNEMISGLGRMLLCADMEHFTDTPLYIKGGVYPNVCDAYTALFQDFSMQLSVEENRYPGVLILPADGAKMQQLLTICYLQRDIFYNTEQGSPFISFAAYGQDLNRILHRNSSGLEGTALFEDILRDPDAHPEVWDQYYERSYHIYPREMGYYVSDLDKDGGEEMLIAFYDTSDYPAADHIIVVDTDGTVSRGSVDFSCSSLMVNVHGVACVSQVGQTGSCKYYDIRHMEYNSTRNSRNPDFGVFFNHTAGISYTNMRAVEAEENLYREDGMNVLEMMHPYDFGKLDSLETDIFYAEHGN